MSEDEKEIKEDGSHRKKNTDTTKVAQDAAGESQNQENSTEKDESGESGNENNN